ncbi:MAG: murein biosynthesis integral membrane protein MurJ [Desulfatitalea sp.]|nr:murein biosynthesis integral membrane protein MurJ [Desulfatitalea sp.]
MVRAAGVVGGATLLSRILGAVRDIVIASFFGAALVSDAFFAAFRIPNLLRRLFGEGSLSIAFVPAYSDILYQQGRSEADRLANSALRLLALLLALSVLLGLAAAPWLVHLLAPGFGKIADKFALTVDLTRLMMPYVFFIGLVSLWMAVLNVLGHFAAPALAPVVLNAAMIAAIGAGAFYTRSDTQLVRWLAVGVVVGGVLQLLLQVPFLIRKRVYFWRPAGLWHPAFQRIAWMMGPVLFGTAVYQINSLVVTLLASLLPQGSVSYLYYADRVVQFPLGIFGVATATAVLPTMARQSAVQQFDALRATFGQAIRLVLFITLPAMAGLIVLREPIVALLFQRGAFDGASVRLTASALLYYGMGLWAYSAVRVVLNVFYALKDTRTPVRMAVVSIAANMVFSAVLMGPMDHNGLALALSLSSACNLLMLTAALRKRLGPLGWRDIAISAAKSAACASVMGLCVWGLAHWLLPAWNISSVVLATRLIACMTAGVIIFFALAHALKIEEMRTVREIIARRKPK